MGPEKCRAQALNKPAVDDYFEMLEELIVKYKIEKHNIYNMDGKGIQLRVGGRVRAIVDRDQKTVHTVIGSWYHSSNAQQQKGVRRNLEWGRQNPCKAGEGIEQVQGAGSQAEGEGASESG